MFTFVTPFIVKPVCTTGQAASIKSVTVLIVTVLTAWVVTVLSIWLETFYNIKPSEFSLYFTLHQNIIILKQVSSNQNDNISKHIEKKSKYTCGASVSCITSGTTTMSVCVSTCLTMWWTNRGTVFTKVALFARLKEIFL